MAPYRILSLDGGGIRGIVTIVLMQRLARQAGLEGWLDRADLIAGTSTGGLLALAIAKGMDLAEMRELYETKGRVIFDDSWLDDLRDLGKIAGADYDTRGLERELERVFGDTTLAQLRRRVLVTAFDLDNEDPDAAKRRWKPKLFHNFPGRDRDGAALARKVGVYTAAAPTYFPSYEGYVDGGVYATNPSMCALAQALDRRQRRPAALDDIVLLSLGTGTPLTYIKGQELDWGFAQWARSLVSLMLDGVAGIADFQCEQLLGERYNRLAPAFPPGKVYDMDDWRRVPEMIAFAESVPLRATAAFLRDHW
jgi:patatin-like phospholipase/acyl hydrolase